LVLGKDGGIDSCFKTCDRLNKHKRLMWG